MSNIQNSIDDARKASEEINKMLSQGLIEIAQLGWYIFEDFTLHEIIELGNLAKEKDTISIDDFFKKYYSRKMKLIINKQVEQFPERNRIINEGYKTHKSKLFFSSTALFLSQADGICSGELFKTRRDKVAIKEFLAENYVSSAVPKLLEVITKESAIDVYYPDKSKYSSSLNRHGVFHGYDVDYGTEINSLKAFSLLSFITSMVTRYKIWKKA